MNPAPHSLKRPGSPERAFGSVRACGAAGFTLIEMLLALGVSAIVLAAVGGVLFSAMRLRERTAAMLDETGPLQHALNILRRDLRGALPPGGVLAGDFKSGSVSSLGQSSSGLGQGMSSGLGSGYGLQFSTTTGVIRDGEPWGDVQEVIYELREPTIRTNAGKDLFRTVTRNLLSTAGTDATEQWLLGNVEQMDFLCYDGNQWRDNWDTSLTDTNLPTAVRIRIQLVPDENADRRYVEPLELLVPLTVQSRTNQTTTTSSGGAQ